MKCKNAIGTLIALFITAGLSADEGMWMVNSISDGLYKKMKKRGLELPLDSLYNCSGTAVSSVIAAVDFMGTGSLISDKGLIITNHHVAYADIHSVSTMEHNYLRDGFYARDFSEEIPIPGRNMYFLRQVIDVTDEALELAAGMNRSVMFARKISHLLEKKYSEQTGLEASLGIMWAGERYYIYLYDVYQDVRLVAAPPESIAAFGGDIDNWEWPQHKCDFAMYRVYASKDGKPAKYSADNVPLSTPHHLKLCTDGLGRGDFAMVMGYPGVTHRYNSSATVRYKQDVKLPVSNYIRGRQMEIIGRWMNADPDIRLKYSDKFFNLSNVQELYCGEKECYERFGVAAKKAAMEKNTHDARLLSIVDSLEMKYADVKEIEQTTDYFRETLVRSSALGTIATRLKNYKGKNPYPYERDYSNLDMRVEKDLFFMSVEEFYKNVPAHIWGPYQKEVHDMFTRDGICDYAALGAYLWTDTYMTKDDNIYKFYNDISMAALRKIRSDIEGDRSAGALAHAYTAELYKWRLAHGKLQYPDANSTLRLTYGRVSTYRRDGRTLPWQTWSGQILAKEDTTRYEFTLKPEWRSALQGQKIPVDFITDCDITGGNSGSPVLNGRGELVGLAFDGNKESLASDSAWTEGYNKCICVDIRFVLWTLEHYMGMSNIIREINN